MMNSTGPKAPYKANPKYLCLAAEEVCPSLDVWTYGDKPISEGEKIVVVFVRDHVRVYPIGPDPRKPTAPPPVMRAGRSLPKGTHVILAYHNFFVFVSSASRYERIKWLLKNGGDGFHSLIDLISDLDRLMMSKWLGRLDPESKEGRVYECFSLLRRELLSSSNRHEQKQHALAREAVELGLSIVGIEREEIYGNDKCSEMADAI